jgi:hypothetical protein
LGEKLKRIKNGGVYGLDENGKKKKQGGKKERINEYQTISTVSFLRKEVREEGVRGLKNPTVHPTRQVQCSQD